MTGIAIVIAGCTLAIIGPLWRIAKALEWIENHLRKGDK